MLGKWLRCSQCTLFNGRRDIVPGRGNLYGWLLIVGQAPGVEEELGSRPFIGSAGKLLRRCAVEAGLDLRGSFITNAVLCYPPANRPPSSRELMCCSARLHHTLETVGQVVLCLGRVAADACLGRAWRWNQIVQKDKKLWLPTKHPSWYLKREEKEIGGLVKVLKAVAHMCPPWEGANVDMVV